MKRTLPAILMIACVCSACSVLHGDNAPTIASLGKHPVKLNDTPVYSSEVQAISAYRSFLDSGDESDSRPQAMRRIEVFFSGQVDHCLRYLPGDREKPGEIR